MLVRKNLSNYANHVLRSPHSINHNNQYVFPQKIHLYIAMGKVIFSVKIGIMGLITDLFFHFHLKKDE